MVYFVSVLLTVISVLVSMHNVFDGVSACMTYKQS